MPNWIKFQLQEMRGCWPCPIQLADLFSAESTITFESRIFEVAKHNIAERAKPEQSLGKKQKKRKSIIDQSRILEKKEATHHSHAQKIKYIEHLVCGRYFIGE